MNNSTATPGALPSPFERPWGTLYILVGPSASGKTTLLNQLAPDTGDHQNPFGRLVTCTTRAPRPGEVNGYHYHFVPEIEGALECEQIAGNQYAVRAADFDEASDRGKRSVVGIADIAGAARWAHHVRLPGGPLSHLFRRASIVGVLPRVGVWWEWFHASRRDTCSPVQLNDRARRALVEVDWISRHADWVLDPVEFKRAAEDSTWEFGEQTVSTTCAHNTFLIAEATAQSAPHRGRTLQLINGWNNWKLTQN